MFGKGLLAGCRTLKCFFSMSTKNKKDLYCNSSFIQKSLEYLVLPLNPKSKKPITNSHKNITQIKTLKLVPKTGLPKSISNCTFTQCIWNTFRWFEEEDVRSNGFNRWKPVRRILKWRHFQCFQGRIWWRWKRGRRNGWILIVLRGHIRFLRTIKIAESDAYQRQDWSPVWGSGKWNNQGSVLFNAENRIFQKISMWNL